MARDLLADTVVTAVGGGRYTASISADWNAAIYIFGGIPMTVALRAAIAELDDDGYVPRSVNAIFCAPMRAGDWVIDAEVLRAGRSARQVSVDVSNADTDNVPQVRMTATFGPSRDEGLVFSEVDFPPGVPRPDEIDSAPLRAGDDIPIPVIRQLEVHPVLGHNSPFAPTEPGPARSARWVRFRRPVGADLPSLAVHADELGLSVMQKRHRDDPFWMVLSLDIGIHLIARPDSEWILLDSTATEAGDGFCSGVVNLWDTSKRLVAVASQRAMIREMPLSPDDLRSRTSG